ncbi:hypothetical protein ACCO45_011701 [Purpureocillium lilacinum]|uniref:Uncharacterized protein n=1 Tax=Purpureocillium lilacinum TaxID=33203 RepID=A0ACC4DBK7_PURLI
MVQAGGRGAGETGGPPELNRERSWGQADRVGSQKASHLVCAVRCGAWAGQALPGPPSPPPPPPIRWRRLAVGRELDGPAGMVDTRWTQMVRWRPDARAAHVVIGHGDGGRPWWIVRCASDWAYLAGRARDRLALALVPVFLSIGPSTPSIHATVASTQQPHSPPLAGDATWLGSTPAAMAVGFATFLGCAAASSTGVVEAAMKFSYRLFTLPVGREAVALGTPGRTMEPSRARDRVR